LNYPWKIEVGISGIIYTCHFWIRDRQMVSTIVLSQVLLS